jgi:Flp pilus assembly pilin Flp
VKDTLRYLWQNEDGASIVEYVFIAALIALATVAALGGLKLSVNNYFGASAGKFAQP